MNPKSDDVQADGNRIIHHSIVVVKYLPALHLDEVVLVVTYHIPRLVQTHLETRSTRKKVIGVGNRWMLLYKALGNECPAF